MSEQLSQLFIAIDRLNSEDPNIEVFEGKELPRERLYSERMSERLLAFCPDASTELQIAARAQHVQRWKSARADYPEGKAGYYRWRTELGKMHAQITAGLMGDLGWLEDSIERVKKLLTKQGIKNDDEVQALEDVICLVFLEHYFLPFAAKHQESKVIDIVQKTWKKMSEQGQAAALELPLSDTALILIKKALDIE